MLAATSEDPRPAPAPAIALARQAVADHPECFWFRADSAPAETVGEIRLIIHRLRQKGGRPTWHLAYALEQCL